MVTAPVSALTVNGMLLPAILYTTWPLVPMSGSTALTWQGTALCGHDLWPARICFLSGFVTYRDN